MISQAVNEATIIEDSREMRRPGRGGRSEPDPRGAASPTRAADPVLPMVLTPCLDVTYSAGAYNDTSR